MTGGKVPIQDYPSSVTLINEVIDRDLTETEERMEQRWWQCVAKNAGNQELLESFSQRAAMGDSSAKVELEILEI